MKTQLINRVRNWSKSSEARPNRGTRHMKAGTGATARLEGGRTSPVIEGWLVHPLEPWQTTLASHQDLSPQHLQNPSSNIVSDSHFDKDGSFTERVCLGPQPQKEKELPRWWLQTDFENPQLWADSILEGGKSCCFLVCRCACLSVFWGWVKWITWVVIIFSVKIIHKLKNVSFRYFV